MNKIGITITAQGAAIVTVEHRSPDDLVVTAIERLPFAFETVADRVADLDEDEPTDSRFTIDAEGLGQALWATLPRENGRRQPDPRRWTLFDAHGLDRQALVDVLVVAIHDGRLHFAPDLAEQDAMTAALVSHRRQVGLDGLIGSELVVALCLAVRPTPPRRGGFAFIG